MTWLVRVATRKPSNQGEDCISVSHVEGSRDASGVVQAEVTWVVARLWELLRAGQRSAGVVTPFRAQADALEAAVLAAFSADQLERLDLRVGTVHAFQGNERDVVIASLAVGPGDSWAFVEDPHLFTVLVTRARVAFEAVVSCSPPAGLVADYLAQADSPPGAPAGAAVSPWVSSIAADLELGGVPVLTGYPVGHEVLDLVSGVRDVAVEAGVHVDGPAAHVDRHLGLLEAGWTVLDAFPSRWGSRRGERVVGLLREL